MTKTEIRAELVKIIAKVPEGWTVAILCKCILGLMDLLDARGMLDEKPWSGK